LGPININHQPSDIGGATEEKEKKKAMDGGGAKNNNRKTSVCGELGGQSRYQSLCVEAR